MTESSKGVDCGAMDRYSGVGDDDDDDAVDDKVSIPRDEGRVPATILRASLDSIARNIHMHDKDTIQALIIILFYPLALEMVGEMQLK